MTVVELLEGLRRLDVHVELDGNRLRLSAPSGALSDGCRRELSERKPEIVTFLRTVRRLEGQPRAIVPLKSTGTRPPIFAVGGHNGDVFCYVTLVRHLDSAQPFYGLQPPGLEAGSEPLTTVESLAGYFADQISDFYPTGPLAVGGFCAGGTIAFELARQLSEAGREVTQVIMFGAAYCGSYRLLPYLADKCGDFARRAVTHTGALLRRPVWKWRGYLAERVEAWRAARGTPPDDGVTARRMAVEKATLAAVRHYQPRAINGRLTLMLPSAAATRSLDAPLRWCRYAAGSSEFVGPDDCTGDTMLLKAHAATFAAFVDSAAAGCGPVDGEAGKP